MASISSWKDHPDVVVPELIDQVRVEGWVLLRILRHCKDSSSVVSGRLLGLDVENRVEVSYAVPHLIVSNSGDKEKLTDEMERCLENVGVQYCSVGWYRSIRGLGIDPFSSDSSIIQTWISIANTQAQVQAKNANAVVLLCDPDKFKNGSFGFRAFRISRKFLTLLSQSTSNSWRKSDAGIPFITREQFLQHKLSSSELFEEIPIKTQNSLLSHALLYELRENPKMSTNPKTLMLNAGNVIPDSISKLQGAVDEYVADQSSYLFQQRKLQRSTSDRDNQQPSRLPNFLIVHQIKEAVDQIQSDANVSLAKLYSSQGIQRPSIE